MTQKSFYAQLRAAHDARWNACLEHRFVHELFAGTLPDAVLRHYLVQDYQFLDSFMALLGAAMASADQFSARVRLARFAADVTGDENTYFQRCFDALGVPATEREAPALSAPTRGFQELMHEAAQSRRYANCIAVLCVAEGLYLDWADHPERALPPRFEHAEWIVLHANDGFRDFVRWLHGELDRLGESTLDEAARAEAASFFARAVALEEAFFDDAMEHA